MFKPSEGQLELSCLQHSLQINWLAGGSKRVEGKSRVKTINPGEVKIVKTCEAYRCYMLYGSHLISLDLNWSQCGRVLASWDSWRRIIKHTVEWLSAFLWWWRLRRSNWILQNCNRFPRAEQKPTVVLNRLDLQVKGIVWSHWSNRLRLKQQRSQLPPTVVDTRTIAPAF